MSRKRKGEVVPVTPPSERRVAAWGEAETAVNAMPVRPKLKLGGENGNGAVQVEIEAQGEVALVQKSLGSQSGAFVDMVVGQLINLSADGGKPSTDDLNAALAFVAAVEPRNEVETALAVQMFGAQRAALEMMLRARRATMLPQFQTYGNMGNKWARTFATLTDSLVKLRNGGAQTVRHVHVSEGGQAIVADHFHAGGTRER